MRVRVQVRISIRIRVKVRVEGVSRSLDDVSAVLVPGYEKRGIRGY